MSSNQFALFSSKPVASFIEALCESPSAYLPSESEPHDSKIARLLQNPEQQKALELGAAHLIGLSHTEEGKAHSDYLAGLILNAEEPARLFGHWVELMCFELRWPELFDDLCEQLTLNEVLKREDDSLIRVIGLFQEDFLGVLGSEPQDHAKLETLKTYQALNATQQEAAHGLNSDSEALASHLLSYKLHAGDEAYMQQVNEVYEALHASMP